MKTILAVTVVLVSISGCVSSSSISYQDSFLCEAGEEFQATLEQDIAQIKLNQQEYTIPRVRSASGAKYVSDDRAYRLFAKGNEALLMIEGESFRGCVKQ